MKTHTAHTTIVLLLSCILLLTACRNQGLSLEEQAILYADATRQALTQQALGGTLSAPGEATPVPDFTWSGNWQVYETFDGESYGPYPMTAAVDGRTFTAVITLDDGTLLTLDGALSADGLAAAGGYLGQEAEGNFSFFALGSTQFQDSGFRGEAWGWCGAREGGSPPDPCFRQ